MSGVLVDATLADPRFAILPAPPAPTRTVREKRRARLGLLIWALLFFNGLAFNDMPLLIHIPTAAGKLLTQGALALALVLVLAFNRARLARPNLFLTLFSLLAASSLMVSVRLASGPSNLFRAGRMCTFIGVLWLISPLFGRADRVLLRWHVICLTAILSTVAVGFLIAPGRATQTDGRLGGQIWPIPPPQVGHYSAVLTGIVVVLGLCGVMRGRIATSIALVSTALLLLTHTRTALIALIVAVVCAMLSLMTIRRRVRRAGAIVLVAGILAATVFAPAVKTWYSRGQSKELVGQLNGRREVWDALVKAPRSRFTEIFGIGLTNKSYGGLSIDNSWYATYQDQGLFGDAICAAILLSLLLIASTRPRGPSVAVAVFLIVYCAIASFTETGLGDVSPYVLDLAVAAALLTLPGDTLARAAAAT